VHLNTDWFLQQKMNAVAVHRSMIRKIIATSERKTFTIQDILKIVRKKNENLII